VWLSCGRFAFVEDVLSTGGKWRRYLMRMSLAKVGAGGSPAENYWNQPEPENKLYHS